MTCSGTDDLISGSRISFVQGCIAGVNRTIHSMVRIMSLWIAMSRNTFHFHQAFDLHESVLPHNSPPPFLEILVLVRYSSCPTVCIRYAIG